MQPISTNLFCEYTEKIQDYIKNIDIKYVQCKKSYNKLRAKKLPINLIINTLLSPLAKSLQFELIDLKFMENPERAIDSYVSKSAFSQMRAKINWKFFKKLSQYSGQIAEKSCPNERLYKGYRLVAADGTTIILPLTSATRREFKTVKNQYNSQCVPRCSVLMDVLNNWCYNADIGTSLTSEKSQLYEHLEFIPQNSILILDRLYPSSELIYELNRLNIKFVMRSKNELNAEIKAMNKIEGEQDEIVTHRISEKAVTNLKLRATSKEEKKKITYKEEITYRIIKAELANNQRETLLTNILDEFDIEDFKTIYNHRWGVEIGIDVLKNTLAMEYLSGYNVNTIKQDFYATICKYNMIQFFYHLANSILANNPKPKNNRINAKNYPQQANMALTASIVFKALKLKNHQPDLFEKFVNLGFHFLYRFPEPVRKNRSFPRKKKVHKSRGRIKYDINYKRSA